MEFQTFENVNVRNNVYKWIAVFTVFSHAFDFFSSQKNEKVEERTFLYSSNFSLLNIFDFFVYLFPRERANGLLIGKCRCWFRSFFIPASRGVYKVYIEQSSITLPRLRIYRSVTQRLECLVPRKGHSTMGVTSSRVSSLFVFLLASFLFYPRPIIQPASSFHFARRKYFFRNEFFDSIRPICKRVQNLIIL